MVVVANLPLYNKSMANLLFVPIVIVGFLQMLLIPTVIMSLPEMGLIMFIAKLFKLELKKLPILFIIIACTMFIRIFVFLMLLYASQNVAGKENIGTSPLLLEIIVALLCGIFFEWYMIKKFSVSVISSILWKVLMCNTVIISLFYYVIVSKISVECSRMGGC